MQLFVQGIYFFLHPLLNYVLFERDGSPFIFRIKNYLLPFGRRIYHPWDR